MRLRDTPGRESDSAPIWEASERFEFNHSPNAICQCTHLCVIFGLDHRFSQRDVSFRLGVRSVAGEGEKDMAKRPSGSMDRFTQTTRDVIQLAKQSSIEFKHTHVTPEHILLGLLRQKDEDVSRAFDRAKASPEQIRELVLHHLRPDEEGIPEHLIAFSERAKRVIESARQEAKRERTSQLAPEHLLLGLTLVPNTVCGAVLRAVGLTTESVRQALGN
jgi:hypothetical protein